MADTSGQAGPFRTDALSQSRPTTFAVAPDGSMRAHMARELGVSDIRKLTFEGEITPKGRQGFVLAGRLGATVVQPCVVTTDPVATRIDTDVLRAFLPEAQMDQPEAGSEVEMPEDDSAEPLGDEIAPEAVMIEALALAIPDYPRRPDAALGAVTAEPDGAEPIRDADLKPFAGLAGLRDKLAGDADEE